MVYCNKCGKKLADNAQFCNKCGKPVEKIKEESPVSGGPDARLVKYCMQMLQQGYPKYGVFQRAVRAGWSPNLVNEALASLSSQTLPHKAVPEQPEGELASTEMSENSEGWFSQRKRLIIGGGLIAVALVILVAVLVNNVSFSETSYPSIPSYSSQGSQAAQTQGTASKSATQASTEKKIVCGDGVCEGSETMSNCCRDCSCYKGFYCTDGSCRPKCGDSICVSDETQATCCLDCGCPEGYECNKADNKCVISKPEIAYQLSINHGESATVLYALPEDIINQEEPLVTAQFENKGTGKARNVQFKVKLGEYSDWTVRNAGEIAPGESKEINVTPRVDSKILALTTDTNVPVNLRVIYEDTSGKEYSKEETKETIIKGRNTFSWVYPELTAAWITSTDPVIRNFATQATSGLAPAYAPEDIMPAVERIFNDVKAFGVRYASDPSGVWGDYLQFPVETLSRKNGDCDDMAVLFAALFRAVGIDAGVVLVPMHAYTWFKANGTKYAFEGTAVGWGFPTPKKLEDTLKQYNPDQYEITDPDTAMSQKGVKMVNVPNPPSVNVPQISISLDANEDSCGFGLFGKWYRCIFNVMFTNTGGQGHRCVNVYNLEKSTYKKKDEQKVCTDVPSGGFSKQIELDADYGKEYTFGYEIVAS